jgi:hypothetical protein
VVQKAQFTRAPNRLVDERIRRILERLESDNPLRFALERGLRGSGRHHAWMNQMQKLGVKQAAYRIRFNWKKQDGILDVVDVKYLQRYYQYQTAITEQSLLNQIRDSGLEEELRNEILLRARAFVVEKVNASDDDQLCGTLYINLLDDEVLPILDEPADLEENCQSLYRK